MRARGRIRPSRPLSAVGMIVGIICVGIGVVGALDNPIPGIIFALVALGITIYHGANILMDSGVAHDVVEFDATASDPSTSATSPPESTEQRLRELESLKAKTLITDEEYERQRKRILDDL